MAELTDCGAVAPRPANRSGAAPPLSAAEAAAVDVWAAEALDSAGAERALRTAGCGVGSFCLRKSASSDEHVVLCVVLEYLEVAQYRICLAGAGACTLLDAPGSPFPFKELHACIAELKLDGFDGFDDVIGTTLTTCVPYDPDAVAAAAAAPARRQTKRLPDTALAADKEGARQRGGGGSSSSLRRTTRASGSPAGSRRKSGGKRPMRA
jgi:hypothetical protein